MPIIKSSGVTPTEKLLVSLCEKSFLKLWSYPNPFKDDGKELCDLLVVFENRVFIFFDRESNILNKSKIDYEISWKRWKKYVIDNQTRTAFGAERYLRSGRNVYLDQGMKVPFPLDIDIDKIIIHKIIIAHGAQEACKNFSDQNIYGSLAVSYGNDPINDVFPFMINIDKSSLVHVFDSHNLPIIFSELDTVVDFSTYLDKKVEAINSLDSLMYCGEEDLLAHYFMNFDETTNTHYIGTKKPDINCVAIAEGEWLGFSEYEIYKNRKKADKVSYLWDELIQKTCQNALDGTLLGNSNLLRGKSAIHEMAKEPRFVRRALSQKMIQSMQDFPVSAAPFIRKINFMPSYYKDKGYVFLQLKVENITDYDNEYRIGRQNMLEIACAAAKIKFDHLKTIIGIAIDAPKLSKNRNSEDFILMDCSCWTEEQRAHYEDANKELKFFKSDSLKQYKETISEFPSMNNSSKYLKKKDKTGRNESCPCGSGRKYKKCCINK